LSGRFPRLMKRSAVRGRSSQRPVVRFWSGRVRLWCTETLSPPLEAVRVFVSAQGSDLFPSSPGGRQIHQRFPKGSWNCRFIRVRNANGSLRSGTQLHHVVPINAREFRRIAVTAIRFRVPQVQNLYLAWASTNRGGLRSKPPSSAFPVSRCKLQSGQRDARLEARMMPARGASCQLRRATKRGNTSLTR
jgi:hypothetical protein